MNRKKKLLLIGDYCANAGPANVNRSLVEIADDCLVVIKPINNRMLRVLANIVYCIFYKNILISGTLPSRELFISILLRKNIYYLMHGCVEYENLINELNISDKILGIEKKILRVSKKIIAVSENYANWLINRYPEYESKITFVNNGLNINEVFVKNKINANIKSIALTGGNRFQKCNEEICKAVKKINENGTKVIIKVFGRFYRNGDDLLKYPFVQSMGHLGKEEYLTELSSINLLVINSEVESFGLVVGDALNCGCSLLMSKNVGAIDVFDKLHPEDIIQNNHSVDEIKSKILFLLENSNAERLFNDINRDKCSSKLSYLKLKQICLNE